MPAHAMPVRLLLLMLLGGALLAAPPQLPAWLDAAAKQSVPTYGPKVNAVVLVDEAQVTVDGAGMKSRRVRYAVRILNDRGRGMARASVAYYMGAGKVKRLQAWLRTPSGNVREYDKKLIDDHPVGSGSVYEDVRARSVNASADALPGSVFGYEAEEEDRSIFQQETWSFQSREPVLSSSFTLQLPVGWKATAITRNTAPLQPAVQGNSYRWEMKELPPIEREEAAPRLSSLAPILAVSYAAADGGGDAAVFRTWADVARWSTELQRNSTQADAAIRAKVAELTCNASSPWERIQAVARFAQGIRYASIQLGLARGGGYTARPAAQVLAQNFGDCKDKSNLMAVMLREAGIPAFLTLIYSGDRQRVDPQWPSPSQFNHAIVAVQVPPDIEQPAVGEWEGLGRLLLFDPTDEDTPLGLLPGHEQASPILVLAENCPGLVTTPRLAPETSHVHREVTAELKPDGSLSANITELTKGDVASSQRALHKALSPPDYRKYLDAWLARSIPGARLTTVEIDDTFPNFQRQTAIEADVFGQRMGGKLWLFRPSLLDRNDAYELRDETRRQSFLLEPDSFTESATVRLPAGYVVDEAPEPIRLESEYGSYDAQWNLTDGALQFKQSLTLQPKLVAPEDYPKLRDFLLKVRGAGNSPVVLARQ
jgi:hypothetical protein